MADKTEKLSTFDSTKIDLEELLGDIASGEVQLPDFQRGWVWDDEHIRSLLASVMVSYPVGAIMLLETGNEKVKFKPRVVEGVELSEPRKPDRLILDGQQRLTSLYQATLYGKAAQTRDSRKQSVLRWYYIDMRKALMLNGDRDEAVISVADDKIVRNFRGEVVNDYSKPKNEYEAELFPLQYVFDSSDWRTGYNEFWGHDPAKTKFWDAFEASVVKRFEKYEMPVITLKKSTPKDAVCQVFEKVNTGGVALTVFELLTATFAAEDFELRKDWAAREVRLSERHPVLRNLKNTDFLQAITLLSTYRDANGPTSVSCKRKDILQLSRVEYESCAPDIERGFGRAAQFLHSQRFFQSRDVPYQTQMTPLAAIFAALDGKDPADIVRSRITRWFWCGVFGELYGSAIESRFAKDLPQVIDWIRGGPEPDTISDASFTPARLRSLRTRNSAAYKGLFALLMRQGGQDFMSGEEIGDQLYADANIDIHHIFPQDWCQKNKIDADRCDCFVNKTAISSRANRSIGPNAPSVYLPRILQRLDNKSEQRLKNLLSSHWIELDHLMRDDFDGFFEAREAAILKQIETAMDKPVAGPQGGQQENGVSVEEVEAE